ncbi:MAG: sodium-translocating pyrophosphatase [Clostridiales bacterium]|nr:sodium-translocating pyrophosphatase [Clostridiales bacterium]
MELSLRVYQIVSILISIGAILMAYWLYHWVKKQECPHERVNYIGGLIKKGAETFLKKEYSILARFTIVVTIFIFVFLPVPVWMGNIKDNLIMAIAYVFGTIFSAIAGKVGMDVATTANTKSAYASTKSIRLAFMSGFRGGSVMGMAVVGASLLGVTLLMVITGDAGALISFSFGASSLALFAKAGGGIFTKSADISADLVGKVEFDIPEDDPRNPAVIADNVGDNVGDVAGMGADLFDSHVASLSAALVLAVAIDSRVGNFLSTSTVFCYAGLGLFASIIGVASARMDENSDPTKALNTNTYLTTAIYGVLTAIATAALGLEWRIWIATILGLLVGVVVGITTDYFTNDDKKPVRLVSEASENGPAFTILSGISYGFMSVVPAMVGIALSALLSYLVCQPLGEGYAMFGIAMSAVGMLSIVAMIISNDAYGPIVDNARGLVEMCDLGDTSLEITDKLDSAGNTVKAITKGFSISAAGLTVISLLGAFISEVNISAAANGIELFNGFDVLNPTVFFGLLVGASIPPLFSSMLINGVGKNAQLMIHEIHRQFKEIPGLREGKEDVLPEYEKCIEIATFGALKELIPAGLMAILATLIVGFVGGINAIGGYLTGNIVSGLVFALFMSNAGGLWDNAKKYVEAGNHGGKGSDAHKAAVVGDTVGDPFKDTAGPSINTQITVVSLVASLAANLFLIFSIF